MRTRVIRDTALALVAGLSLAAAVVVMSAPAPLINYSPPVPTRACSLSVTTDCYPFGSHGPDTIVPPPSVQGSVTP